MNVMLQPVLPWRHELAGPLYACAATLLLFHQIEPLEALGTGWVFYYRPGDVRREEYYFPCRPGVSLLGSLAPHHQVRSRWHRPARDSQAWPEVRAHVAAGRPVAVAVDNYYLPFRPAYQDVHTNHLILVYGFDDDEGTVRVLDAVPPRFDGVITTEQLAAARNSANPARHARDMFFTDNPIAGRWLEVEFTSGQRPAFELGTVRRLLAEYASGCRSAAGPAAPPAAGAYCGLDGQSRFLFDITERLAAGGSIADELFVVAGVALASTALHADWMAAAGRAFSQPVLGELGRQAARIAHHWTAIRIMAALSRDGTVTAERLRRRGRALHADHEVLLADIERAVADLGQETKEESMTA
jgi:hypothetical protein